MSVIAFFAGPDKEENRRAFELVQSLPGAEIEEVAESHLLIGKLLLPFIETEDGFRHFGLRSISRFVERRHEKAGGSGR